MAECTDKKTGRMLHAYELGALTENEERDFDLHLIDCRHCREKVKEFQEFSHSMRNSRRIGAKVKKISDSMMEIKPGIRDRIWPKTNLIFRPLFLYILIVLLLIPGGIKIYELSSTENRIRPLQHITLSPARAVNNSIFSKPKGNEGVINLIYPEVLEGETYSLLLINEKGMKIFSDPAFTGFDSNGMAQLGIMLNDLDSGIYKVRLFSGDKDSLLIEYLFKITGS